jgi:hypothetical protein
LAEQFAIFQMPIKMGMSQKKLINVEQSFGYLKLLQGDRKQILNITLMCIDILSNLNGPDGNFSMSGKTQISSLLCFVN